MLNPRILERILARGGLLWDGLRGANLFLTGGTGYAGCWLLETLLWANRELRLDATATVLTRRPAVFRARVPHLAGDAAVRLHGGDVRWFDYPECRFSHVIHAAGQWGEAGLRDSQAELDLRIEGTRRALDFAVASGARRFLLVNAAAVYGDCACDGVTEESAAAPDPLDPQAAAGEGDRVAELLCALCHQRSGLGTVVARCFGLAGEYLPRAARPAAASYLYGAELALWLWTVLLRGIVGRPYNVGSEEAAPGGQREPRLCPLPSTARARKELGLDAEIAGAYALESAAEWAAEEDSCGVPVGWGR